MNPIHLNNKYLIPAAIIVAGILVAGVFIYINLGGNISAQEAGEKGIAFINKSIQGQGVTASLIDVLDEGEVFRIHLKIAETEYDSYMTKSGKFLFPSGYNLEEQPQEESSSEETNSTVSDLGDFPQCLVEKGMKFYGSKYCSWCTKQKNLFGESLPAAIYVECIDAGTDEWTEECKTAGIESTPTWILPDGQKSGGYKTLEELSELSGCALQ